MFNLFKKKLKYLIIGAGSTGATFSCFLKSANKDVTLISKYENIIKIAKKNKGIRLISTVKGDKKYKINIKTAENYNDRADVIILCIRTPDILSAAEIIEKASHKNTVLLSISNGFGIGYALQKRFPLLNILDSNFVGKCRWYNRESGEYLQQREYCEFNFSPKSVNIDNKVLETIKNDFTESGMITELMSQEKFNRIAFERLITRSPFEACCIYYGINAHQITNEKRIFFEKLCNELIILAKAMNINIDSNFLDNYYNDFEQYKERDDANVYSSILNDMNISQPSEIDFLFFIVLQLAKDYNVTLPTYTLVAEKFKEYNTLGRYFNNEI